MDRKFFDTGMECVSAYFHRGVAKPESIWDQVKDEPNEAFTKAYKSVEMSFHPDQLIGAAKIRDIILQEGRKIREAEIAEREREAEASKAAERQPWKEPPSEYGRCCIKILKATVNGAPFDERKQMVTEMNQRLGGKLDWWFKDRATVTDLRRRAAGE